MKDENNDKEKRRMIVMDFSVDNFYSFKKFHMNMSYPKKIVDSHIKEETLKERTNFRYKKVNILMGGNATGKTSIGMMLMDAFNFMDKKEPSSLVEAICDKKREASFSMDLVVDQYLMYRVVVKILPSDDMRYASSNIDVNVKWVKINVKDSYESCAERLEKKTDGPKKNYVESLEEIQGLSWFFQYPWDSASDIGDYQSRNEQRYLNVLTHTLKVLDPSIQKIVKVKEAKNTYIIKTKDREIVMQNGSFPKSHCLSSGTKAGIQVAAMITSMLNDEHGFYYCDEKFSYIHSDVEKAFLIVMIQILQADTQLFFTTHNTDILDIPLPKHSFSFLCRENGNVESPIKCVSASEYLKRNTDSVRAAFDNDLFSSAPDLDMIYEIAEL